MVREKRDTARQQLGAGIDPGEARKAEKIAQAGTESFEAVAREWYGKFSPGWAANHADRILRRLENDLFPWLAIRLANVDACHLRQGMGTNPKSPGLLLAGFFLRRPIRFQFRRQLRSGSRTDYGLFGLGSGRNRF
jgi:hypothetical protein